MKKQLNDTQYQVGSLIFEEMPQGLFLSQARRKGVIHISTEEEIDALIKSLKEMKEVFYGNA